MNWANNFMKTAPGKAYHAAWVRAMESQQSYQLELQPDGRFEVPDVVAGTYRLTAAITTGSSDPVRNPGPEIAYAYTQFTVPEMPTGRDDTPLELPSLAMKMTRPVNVGDAAPGFTIRTLDNRELKLSDYHGKYVLLEFWTPWGGDVVDMHGMKAVYDAFGANDHFTMISVSGDPTMEAVQGYVRKNNLTWNQVWLPGMWEETNISGNIGIRICRPSGSHRPRRQGCRQGSPWRKDQGSRGDGA